MTSTFGSDSQQSADSRAPQAQGTVDRRTLLKGGAAALTGLAASSAQAQVTGTMPGGGMTPFPLPMGAVDYLDKNQYIHNMEIHSHFEGAGIAGGEPLMAMWAKGTQRLLPGAAPGWVDISDPLKPQLIPTGKVSAGGAVAYNTKLKKWIMMTSHAQPITRPHPDFPFGQYHEEVRQRALTSKNFRGIRVYDVNDPGSPKLLNEFSTGSTGGGTHHNFYDGGKYAYLDCGWTDQLRMEDAGRASSNALMIVDLSDPENVKEVSRWHVPGQMIGEEEEYKKYWFAGSKMAWTGAHGAPTVPIRVEDGGKIGYGGFGHFGLVIFDLTDIKNPKPHSITRWDYEALGAIPHHSCLPILANEKTPQLRNMLLTIPEGLIPDCREPYHPPHLINISDPKNPRFVSQFPKPYPPKEAPFPDYCMSRGRFSTHNVQCWISPGTPRPEIVVTTWFNAGIRVHDISDPHNIREVAYFVPPRGGKMEEYNSWVRGDAERLFVEWDRNLIWLGTHDSTYCLSCPALGKPVLEPKKIDHWSQPHLNAGWDG